MTLQLADTAYDARKFDDNFPPGIEGHYWFRARNKLLDRALRDAARRGFMPERAKILEVGCGTGIVVAALRRAGHDVIGAELGYPEPLAEAAPFMSLGVKAQDLAAATREEIDALMFLDVIEHVPDDVALLRETVRACPKAHVVVVTVPAGPELWSSHDTYYGHFRRYTPALLRASLEKAGLRPIVVRTMFHGLYAAAALMKRLGIDRDPIMRPPRQAALHTLLTAGLVAESALLRPFNPPGLSLLAVAAVSH